MGIRSDVGLALHPALYKLIPDDKKEEWLGDASEKYVREDGTLVIWRDVKWYYSFKEVIDLVEWLSNRPDDMYLLLVATPDYPEDTEQCKGSWHENPFGLYRWTSAGIGHDLE